ncbi:ABC1 kinase family protein, partial [Haloparvum sedimenti]|uniref:ABC1 kinase family protein n=1 Tax=Haloparvum sedimenti TaxID=1678448 RepID=UPI00071E94AE
MVTLVNLRAYWRFLVVVRRFSPLIAAYWRDRKRFLLFGGSRSVGEETQKERAAVLLDILLTLGPTFIKLGQLLSTRPDILPPAYIEVLEELQDDVPPAPFSEAETVLEEELGPVAETFDAFDDEPISGASLGQVYRATYEGEEVAVKVRRPGIEPLVEADLRAIRWGLPLLKRFLGGGRAFSLENLADEFAETIREEMDYRRERRMLEEIGEDFAGDDRIRIPDSYPGASGPRVLTMEYVPGTKINRVDALREAGHDPTVLAEALQRAYLRMIIQEGVFHADPHPGNLAVDESGAIVFYDFGMSDTVDPFVQSKIVDFYVAVASKDTDAILDTLIELGTLSPEADRQVMGEVLELAIADARGEDIEQYRV